MAQDDDEEELPLTYSSTVEEYIRNAFWEDGHALVDLPLAQLKPMQYQLLLVFCRQQRRQRQDICPGNLPNCLPHVYFGDLLVETTSLAPSLNELPSKISERFTSSTISIKDLLKQLVASPQLRDDGLLLTSLQAKRLLTGSASAVEASLSLLIHTSRSATEWLMLLETIMTVIPEPQLLEATACLLVALHGVNFHANAHGARVRCELMAALERHHRQHSDKPVKTIQRSDLKPHYARFLQRATNEQVRVLKQELQPGNKRSKRAKARHGQIMRVSAAAGAGKTTTLER